MTEKRKREKKGKNHFYSISSRCFLHTLKIDKIKREKREKSFLQYLSEGALLTSKSLRKKKRKKGKNPKNILIPSPVAFLLWSEIPRVSLYNSHSDPESSHLCYTDTCQMISRHLCNLRWVFDIWMRAHLENTFVIALIKDLPYCIIVFVFFLGVCGVYIRENILLLLNPLRFCVSLLKEILSVFVIGILSGIFW